MDAAPPGTGRRPVPEETERLLLRPLGPGDVPALASIYRDEGVARYIGGPVLTTEATRSQVERFQMIWRERGYGQSAVIEKRTGQVIGRVGLHVWPVWDAVELGYVIRSDRQCRGFAREASRAWIAWADHALDAEALIAVIHPENLGSARLATRLGFVHDRREVTPQGTEVEIYRRLPGSS